MNLWYVVVYDHHIDGREVWDRPHVISIIRYKYDMKILLYGWTFDQFTMYLDSVELLRQATQWSLSAQPCILDVLNTILKLESEGKCFKEDGNPTHLSFFNTCMISRFYSSSWYLYSRSVLFLKRYLYSRSSTWHG